MSEHFASLLFEELRQFLQSSGKTFPPALWQVANVASLPGIVGASVGLPDIHSGYGFAIGKCVVVINVFCIECIVMNDVLNVSCMYTHTLTLSNTQHSHSNHHTQPTNNSTPPHTHTGNTAAFDVSKDEAIVSPGGVGFDINCGVRMLRTNLLEEQLTHEQKELLCDALFAAIPVGVGCRGSLDLGPRREAELDAICRDGMAWALAHGLAWPEDLPVTERSGCMPGADPRKASRKARGRAGQLGTLGSGNHYVEVQAVEEIYDAEAAQCMGITRPGQLCVMIHCGSRGFGHQVASDFVNLMTERGAPAALNDPQLVCMPAASVEGRDYLAAMAAAANFAFVNRSAIATQVRSAFERVFSTPARELDMHQVYDVAHNIASLEEHVLPDGRIANLLVHRKGSTRAFPPGHPDLPEIYRDCGQPVLIGGSMGTCSYVMTGQPGAMRHSFGSTCHGAGRAMSRGACKRILPADAVLRGMADKGISIRVASPELISEEAPESYKDVVEVVEVCHVMGLSKKAIKLRPIAVIKG